MKSTIPSLKGIDKEARKEIKNVRKFKDENQLLFMSFILLIAAAVIVFTTHVINQSSTPAQTTSTNTAVAQESIYRSLEHAKTPAATVVINNVTQSDAADPAFPLGEGMTLLIVDMTITNTSSAKQQVIPVSQLFVHDRDGGLYPLQASMNIQRPLGTQDLAPGANATGEAAFAIPKRQTSPLLFIDLGWDNHTPIVFDVLH